MHCGPLLPLRASKTLCCHNCSVTLNFFSLSASVSYISISFALKNLGKKKWLMPRISNCDAPIYLVVFHSKNCAAKYCKVFQNNANRHNQIYKSDKGALKDPWQPRVELPKGLNGAASPSHHLTRATIRLSKSCNTDYTRKI